jgi:hypothetical protein
MTSTRLLAVAAFAFAVDAPLLLAQTPTKVDVSGKWLFTVQTDNGTGTPTVTFKQHGDSLSGHYSSQLLGERELTGTVKDNRITFKFATEVQGTALTVTYSGTIDTKDSMKGSVDLGGFASGSFTAKRQ